jgi:leader peptidase (prepilin peptidase)/N-methyltransferase
VLAANCLREPDRAVEWTLAALGASAFLFAALIAYPKGMGMGDVKLALLLGAALGQNVAVGMAIGMLTALAAGIVVIARGGLGARKTAIPFGPFLALGSVVAVFAGASILDAYLGLF